MVRGCFQKKPGIGVDFKKRVGGGQVRALRNDKALFHSSAVIVGVFWLDIKTNSAVVCSCWRDAGLAGRADLFRFSRCCHPRFAGIIKGESENGLREKSGPREVKRTRT